VISISRAEKQC